MCGRCLGNGGNAVQGRRSEGPAGGGVPATEATLCRGLVLTPPPTHTTHHPLLFCLKLFPNNKSIQMGDCRAPAGALPGPCQGTCCQGTCQDLARAVPGNLPVPCQVPWQAPGRAQVAPLAGPWQVPRQAPRRPLAGSLAGPWQALASKPYRKMCVAEFVVCFNRGHVRVSSFGYKPHQCRHIQLGLGVTTGCTCPMPHVRRLRFGRGLGHGTHKSALPR